MKFCLPGCLCGRPAPPEADIAMKTVPEFKLRSVIAFPTMETTETQLATMMTEYLPLLRLVPLHKRLFQTLTTCPVGGSFDYYQDFLRANRRWGKGPAFVTLLYAVTCAYISTRRSPTALAYVRRLLDLGLCPNAGGGGFASFVSCNILRLFTSRDMLDPCRAALLMAGAYPGPTSGLMHTSVRSSDTLRWCRWHARLARRLWCCFC